MKIHEQENKLFEKWSQKYEGLFIEDGTPCPEQFEKEEIKITFILKEANAPGESWNMRSWISNYGGAPKTWNNVTRWTQAILEGGDYPQFISGEDRINWLKRISFLNLKKTGGGRASNPAEIEEYAKNDAYLIYEQIRIYHPDIVVCCGINLVADCLADYVFHFDEAWEFPARCFYVQLPEKTGRTAVLNFYHPLNLGTGFTNEELFNEISKITPEILNGR